MKLYKLTDEHGRTKNKTQWGPGVTHEATGSPDQHICSNEWIHAYEHPLLAVLLNPIHADFHPPRLWEAEGVVGKKDGQLKCGCRSLTTVREIPVPEITLQQRVRFAILCAKQVCSDEDWNQWADAWLSGADRSREAAQAAEEAAAAWAQAADWAAQAAKAAAWAEASRAEAWQAASARAAREAILSINLISIAEQAIAEEPKP